MHTKWANAYEAGQPSTTQLASIVLFDSEAGVGDLRDYVRGIVTSQDHFREAVDREDLRALGTRFDVPFFISQGAQDNVTPVVPVRDYFETIRSPEKEMVVIPGGGHNVAMTMSGEFLKLPVDRVKPLSGSCPSIQDRQSRRRWHRTVTSRCRCATRVKPAAALRHD